MTAIDMLEAAESYVDEKNLYDQFCFHYLKHREKNGIKSSIAYALQSIGLSDETFDQ